MARRGKSSAAGDLIDLVAILPWWGGVALAFAGYWVLHAAATRPLSAAEAAHQGSLITTSIWQGFATAGQYVVPLICLLGAAISAARRWKRRSLFETASTGKSADTLQGITWQEFELLVGEGFRRRGYAVKEIGGGGADGGVDLVLTKSGEKSFVQCKQWKAFKVGVSTVRELYGVMAAHGAAEGFVVTSGSFTKEAAAFARGRNIRLVDGAALMLLLRAARSSKPETNALPSGNTAPKSTVAPGSPVTTESPHQLMEPTISTSPACPSCGKPMVRRLAKRGTLAGKVSWGCSDFSAGCRGTRDIAGM